MTDRPRHDRAGEPEQAAGRTSRCWREKSTATGSAQSAFDALTLEYNALRQELSDRLGIASVRSRFSVRPLPCLPG